MKNPLFLFILGFLSLVIHHNNHIHEWDVPSVNTLGAIDGEEGSYKII